MKKEEEEEPLKEMFYKKHSSYAWPFYRPVDTKQPDSDMQKYTEVIKTPMDLGTVKSKLESSEYQSAAEFGKDIRLIFSNCYKYYPHDHSQMLQAKVWCLVRLVQGSKNPDERGQNEQDDEHEEAHAEETERASSNKDAVEDLEITTGDSEVKKKKKKRMSVCSFEPPPGFS